MLMPWPMILLVNVVKLSMLADTLDNITVAYRPFSKLEMPMDTGGVSFLMVGTKYLSFVFCEIAQHGGHQHSK
jgi:hypothetical protein